MGQIIKKQDLLYLFNNGDKPSGMDFEALIDFADNTLTWIMHEVKGTGERPVSVDINEFLNFTTQYSEVHLIRHQVLGTYIFKETKTGTYGSGIVDRTVTEEDLLHIAPSPDIINDNSPYSTKTTFSASYVTDTFYNKEDADGNYVSKKFPTIIEPTTASIDSLSTIKATNLINDITYDKGFITLHLGPDFATSNKSVGITPNVNTYKLDVPSKGASSIVADFNLMLPEYKQFKKGDVVFLEYDLSSVEDENGDFPYGKNIYVIVKEFPYEADENNGFKLTNEVSDLLQINTLTKEYLWYNYYNKQQLDNKLVNLASGITGTKATYRILVDTVPFPGNGEQWIVEKYFDDTLSPPMIPVDKEGNPVSGDRGVFIYQGADWVFVYTQAYDHNHNNLYYTKSQSDSTYETKNSASTNYLNKTTAVAQDIVANIRLQSSDPIGVGISLLTDFDIQAANFIGSGKKLNNFATHPEVTAGVAPDLFISPLTLKTRLTAELSNYLPLVGGEMSDGAKINFDDGPFENWVGKTGHYWNGPSGDFLVGQYGVTTSGTFKAITWKGSGEVGIGGDALTSYALNVSGNSNFNNTIACTDGYFSGKITLDNASGLEMMMGANIVIYPDPDPWFIDAGAALGTKLEIGLSYNNAGPSIALISGGTSLRVNHDANYGGVSINGEGESGINFKVHGKSKITTSLQVGTSTGSYDKAVLTNSKLEFVTDGTGGGAPGQNDLVNKIDEKGIHVSAGYYYPATNYGAGLISLGSANNILLDPNGPIKVSAGVDTGFGAYKQRKLTQSTYDGLSTPLGDTLYIIVG